MPNSAVSEAIEILRANDRGGYTIPTARLYPYQWNWDSAFAALGFSYFDRARAWRELDLLFEAQWADGMVPHIVFRRNDPDYFPGPAIWQSGTEPQSSGISQPPVAASIVHDMVVRGGVADLNRARALFPKLVDWHRWYLAARDPDGTGVIGIVHPWESGRDNCPDWDSGMAGVTIAPDLGPYHRRDTDHVDPAERPSTEQYDRYLTMVKFGRDCRWNQAEIARNGPFFMADPGIHFILTRANRDLLALADRLGEAEAAAEIGDWIARLEAGAGALWNPAVNAFCAKDLRSGTFSDGLTNASVLAWYAGAGTAHQQEAMLAETRRILDRVEYAFPSWDPDHPAFEARRYWRGPVWLVMNAMIARGLAECGHGDLARRIDADGIRLTDLSGFWEYFDPLIGAGLGGPAFTWTAAIRIALAHDATGKRAA
ncbi:MAG: hypothetical protein KDJ77_13935 [Rhodobiaceae bacterium]|nr:hypothetical protein [Rhodobiaceae bacterium]